MNKTYSPVIMDMVDETVRLCDPCSIYLVSEKKDKQGDTVSFKLCIVIPDCGEPEAVETRLLLQTDCPVPCDFIVYSLEDWNDLAEDDCSFAYRVENGGDLIYVKRQ